MKFYGTTQEVRSDYPNGLRFRFMKNINTFINQEEKSKVIHLREKQRAFLRCIRTTQIPYLIQLDYNPKPDQPTARQMIMSINSANTEPPRPLFISADLNWNGTSHTIQHAIQHQGEAECIINTLYPFLSHFFPDAGVDALFSAEAKESSKDLVYDTDLQMIVDKNAQDMDEDDDDLLGFDIEFSENDLENQLRPSERNINPYDDETVSTFATQRSKRRRVRVNEINHGSNSVASLATIATLRNEIAELRALLNNRQNNPPSNSADNQQEANTGGSESSSESS